MNKQKSERGWRGMGARLARRFRAGWRTHFALPIKQSGQLRAFWIIGLTAGILMVLITPPLMGYDETSHFRAVTFYSEGGHREIELRDPDNHAVRVVEINANTAQVIDIAGGIQRKGLIEPSMYKFFLPRENEPQGYAHADLGGAAVYSPVAYGPPIIGMLLAKLAHLPVLFQMWGARLACLLVYLVLAYLALRCIPFGKWALFVIALLPMTLFQAATITTDGFLNGLIFLFVAVVLRLVVDNHISPLRKRQLFIALAATTLTIALSKPTYALLAFLVLLIPAKQFATRRDKINFAALTILLSGGLAAIWNLAVKDFALKVGEVYRSGFYLSYNEQLASIIEHPLHLIAVFGRSILENGWNYFSQLFGVFDPQFHALPLWIIVPLALGILLGIAIDAKQIQKLNLWVRGTFGVLALAIAAAIGVTLYLTFTPYAHPVIDGLQGRYFLPLLILFIPVLAFAKPKIALAKPARIFVPLMAVALLAACIQILRVNYWL